MAKNRTKDGMYKNTYGDMSDRRGAYMIEDDMNMPSCAPRDARSIEYGYVACGGVYANDSVNISDKVSSEMATKMNSQLLKDTIF